MSVPSAPKTADIVNPCGGLVTALIKPSTAQWDSAAERKPERFTDGKSYEAAALNDWRRSISASPRRGAAETSSEASSMACDHTYDASACNPRVSCRRN